MTDHPDAESVDTTGSSAKLPDLDPPNVGGESTKAATTDPKAEEADNALKVQYEEAEKKIGEQGKELGDYRTFVREMTPLLEKLESQPEIVEAIMDGKLDATLAKAVSEGKVTIGDAEAVTEAHKEVKKDMGKEYDTSSSEDIEKLINEKVEAKLAEHTQTFARDIKDIETRREFEDKTKEFVTETPDFANYSEAIGDWLDEHPDQFDIEIAYHAVKGKMSVESARREAQVQAGEAAKNTAANAGGGASQGGKLPDGTKLIDQLIAPKANPNSF